MRAAVSLLLCLAVSTFTFAQQELRLGAEETEAIYKKLQQSPLTDDQKQQVRQAIRARDYRNDRGDSGAGDRCQSKIR